MVHQKNEYDWCVMKNSVKGKQYTILWHVDGLKMSHLDYDFVSHVLADIDAEYGNISKIS